MPVRGATLGPCRSGAIHLTRSPEDRAPALAERFSRHLAAHPDLVPRGATVLVALSGGPDSTALLHLLREAAPRHDLRLVAAHFDHGVRPESGREAERLAASVERLGLPWLAGRPAVSLDASQDALRSARYAWLEATRREVGAQRIAMGHQADDQAETVLFRMMRGTGLRGLTGIPQRRDAIARPLLPFRKAELVAYLGSRGIPWTEDPSNEDPRWMRSRIRGRVLPLLEEDDETTLRLIAVASSALRLEALLQGLVDRVLAEVLVPRTGVADGSIALSRDGLLRSGAELQARVLREVTRRCGRRLSGGGTRAAVEFMSRGLSGGRVTIGGSLNLRREFDRFLVGPDEPARSSRRACLEIAECRAGRGSLRIGGRTRTVVWRPTDSHAGRQPGRIAVPVARGHYPLRFREWRAGDRIRLSGGTRKLKKVFGAHRVPRGARGGIPVLEDREGRVLWAVGLAVAAPEPSARDVQFLEFELRDD